MKETKYKSALDWFIYMVIAFTTAFCFGLAIFVSCVSGWIICSVSFLIILLPFLGMFYIVREDLLVVYSFFGSKTVPISKIESIKPTKSIESAPATSISDRIAILFVDRSVMRGQCL